MLICMWTLGLKQGLFHNLRSGPILAVLIHSLLCGRTKIETKSLTLVLAAARFWPQHWLAVRTMSQHLIGCWNHWKLTALIPCVAVALKKLHEWSAVMLKLVLFESSPGNDLSEWSTQAEAQRKRNLNRQLCVTADHSNRIWWGIF